MINNFKEMRHGDIMAKKSLLPHSLTFIYSQNNINIGDIMGTGRGHKKASDEEILKTYQETNNIWKAAEKLGICGQSVWERLKRLSIQLNNRVFSDKEREFLLKNYEGCVSEGRLGELSDLMGRTKQFLTRQAGELGLTDINREKSKEHKAKMVKNAQEWHETHEHPKGFLGHIHTEETKKTLGIASIEVASKKTKKDWKRRAEKSSETRKKNGTTSLSHNTYSRCKGGYREDIDMYVRSRWEANYCRYLNLLKEQEAIFKWEYEADTFRFDGIKRGVQSYTPDFKIWDKKDDEPYYIEIKGYMDAKSKTRLKRMRKYYPGTRLIVITQKDYNKIEKEFSTLIEGWEK